MKKVFVIIFAVFICGCSRSHYFTLIPIQGGRLGRGIAKSGSNVVSISYRDKVYTGKYFYEEIQKKTSTNNNRGSLYDTPSRSHTETAYFMRSANGKLHVISEDGDAIRCEFEYSGRFGKGICRNNTRILGDLIIHN